MRLTSVLLALVGIAMAAGFASAETVAVSSMDLSLMSSGWGKALAKQSITGKPLRIGTETFAEGVGTHAESEFYIDLGGRGEKFEAKVGVDTAAGNEEASLQFIVQGDGKELWRSGLCKWKEPARKCEVDVRGVKALALIVTDGGNGIGYDHADWAEARITFTGAAPRAIAAPAVPVEEAVILTPPPGPAPKINGPTVYGVRPGSPVLYRIPATGDRPMTFAAENLPAGLTLDERTGIITGKIAAAGEHTVTLVAKNGRGEARRGLRIVAGKTLALTPPMGWNSWYIHYNRVSNRTMRAAADAMVASGMADYGYQYVNIDDCWMMKPGSNDPELNGPPRDAQGRIQPNKRFPDMKAMTDYIHAKGLKAGLYTSPGPRTCAGYEAAYKHEAIDARTFAEWGFDFLKYDWCSYSSVAGGKDLEHMQRPYRVMWAELQKLDRDIVFNLCQYGMGEVWKWGGEVGHCWRTTGDLGLEGGKLSKGIYKVGLFNSTLTQFAGPGRWNDPDYLLIGWVGDANRMGEGRPTSLTPNEQYTHMSMWCLMAAPLVFSGDMEKLDPFTLNILCNSEVIDVDQDALGKQAKAAKKTGDVLVLVKEMEDGSKAVGLFNLGLAPMKIAADWEMIGVTGEQRVRDLWRQKDLGAFKGAFEAEVARHGVVMVRMWPAK